ncbi:hypothetical protein [Fluviicola sp.]|uniref:hypothetical protein n=1 Tax=Fluviicola sp. TaxID=1917219 RepID=UPI0031E103FD
MKKDLLNVVKSVTVWMIFCSTAFSQEERPLITTPQLKISYVEGTCDVETGKQPYQFAFLKVENLTGTELHAGFNIVVQFQEGGGSSNDENLYYITLAPSQVYTASCSSDDRSKVYLRNPNFSGSWNFQELRIENLVVE